MFWIRFLATGFYIGCLRPAPGTWGTLMGVPFVFLFYQTGPYGYMICAVAFVALSIWIASRYEQTSGQHDASEVVIDEIAGFILAMTWLPVQHWQTWASAFVLFRILDIWKPLLIGRLDRELKGGFGVVMDDVLAGLICNLVLQMVYLRTNLLGVQWHIQ